MKLAIEIQAPTPIPERALRQVLAAELAGAATERHLPDDPALHMGMIDDGIEALHDEATQ